MNDAFLLLNKPAGLSSAACVRSIKRILKVQRIGHTGTLDPFATGLLPIAIGKATRAIEYLPKTRKVYRAQLYLGAQTDTLDSDGQVIDEQALPATVDRFVIETVLSRFIGTQRQVPPAFSALKYRGKALYHYARAGQEVPIPEREIEVQSLTLLDWQAPIISFEVVCSGGTYVRSLGRDIAHALGTCGHLRVLERLESDGFNYSRALTLSDMELGSIKPSAWVSLEEALACLPRLECREEELARALVQGKKGVLPLSDYPDFKDVGPIAVWWNSQILAVVRACHETACLKIEKVLALSCVDLNQ